MSKQDGYTVVELMILLSIVASIAFGGFVLYIIWHFVQKFW